MKKVIASLSILLSTSVFAEANTSAQLYPIGITDNLVFKKNEDFTFYSFHEYTVSNNTPNVQHISVCFDIVTCQDHPEFLRNTRDCRSFDLNPWETKAGNKNIKLTVNYWFGGSCRVYAQTETSGGSHSISQDIKTFEVK